MESSEPPATSRREDKPYSRAGKSVAESTKAELSDARKTVRDLALKIEGSNLRAKSTQHKPVKGHEQHEQGKPLKNEDYQYARVVNKIEHIKHELDTLKLDMRRVLKEKKRAENTFKASSSKNSMLSSAVERIKKEIEEIDEEHVLVELARIEAVKEREAIEAQRKEEANRYQNQLEEVKKKVKEDEQHDELRLALYNVNLLEKELVQAKETNGSPELLRTIMEELEIAKTELAEIKREGFSFMKSVDVIRNELRHVLQEKERLEKEDEKRELMVRTLNSKVIKGKAKLESVTATAEKANSIASNLSVTVEQLRAENETAKREQELISEEIEKVKLEIPKTEAEIELSERRLEAAMEELKSVKSSEFTALENLKNLIDSTIQSRELTSLSKSTITITNFEYEYLTGKAGGAEEIADKKVAAAQAWVAALKANEKDIQMKTKMTKHEIKKLHVDVDNDGGNMYETDSGGRRIVDADLNRFGQNGVKIVASPRRSMYKIGSMTPGKRGRSQKFLSPAARHAIRSGSFTKKREKVSRSLSKLLDENDETGQ